VVGRDAVVCGLVVVTGEPPMATVAVPTKFVADGVPENLSRPGEVRVRAPDQACGPDLAPAG
jgi:hypothetical protein